MKAYDILSFHIQNFRVTEHLSHNLSLAQWVQRYLSHTPTTSIHQTDKKTFIGQLKDTEEMEKEKTSKQTIIKLFVLHANAINIDFSAVVNSH